MNGLVQTQVSLTKLQHTVLKQVKQSTGLGMSENIRRAVDRYLAEFYPDEVEAAKEELKKAGEDE